MNAGEIVIGLNADTSGFTQQMKSAEQQSGKSAKSISDQLNRVSAASAGLDRTTDSTKDLSQSIVVLRQSLDAQTAAHDKASKSTVVATQAAKTNQSAVADQGAEHTKTNKVLAETAVSQKQVAVATDQSTAAHKRFTDSAKEVQRQAEKSTSMLHKLGAALAVYGGVKIASEASKFGITQLTPMGVAKAGAQRAFGGGDPDREREGISPWSLIEKAGIARKSYMVAAAPEAMLGPWIVAALAEQVVEGTIKQAYRQGAVEMYSGRKAGLNPQTISAVDYNAINAAGKERSGYLDLANTLADKNKGSNDKGTASLQSLIDAGKKLHEIKDPTDKAREAVKLFGDDAAKALALLDNRFISNAERVRNWGLVYSETDRQNLMEFRRDINDVKEEFSGFGDVIADTLKQAEVELVSGFARLYKAVKDFDRSISKPVEEAFDDAVRPVTQPLTRGIGGLAYVIGQAFEDSQHDEQHFKEDIKAPFFSPAERQSRRELNEVLKPGVTEKAKEAYGKTANIVPLRMGYEDIDKITATDPVEKIEQLHQKLEQQKQYREKVFSTYFKVGPSGGTVFKDSFSDAQKRNAVSALNTAKSDIFGTQALIDAAEKAKRDAETAANKSKEAAEIRKSMMMQVGANLEVSRLNIPSLGSGDFGRQTVAAKGQAEATKFIADRNRELAKYGVSLSGHEKATIRSANAQIALNNAETEWRTKLADAEVQLRTMTEGAIAHTAAIGQGGAAARQAAIEQQVSSTLGVLATDKQFMGYKNLADQIDHLRDRERLRADIAANLSAQALQRTQQETQTLREDIIGTQALTAAEVQGADAINRVTLALKENKIWRDAANDSERKAAATQINRMNALDEEQRKQQSTRNVVRTGQDITAIQAATRAQLDGAEAVRVAQLNAKYSQMEFQNATPDEIGAERVKDMAARQQDILQQAMSTGNSYRDQVDSLDQQIAALEQVKASGKDNLAIEISLRELELQRNRVLSDQTMIFGTAREGMQAFFREMSTGSISAAAQMSAALRGAFDGINDSLSRLISGQKANWASFFQGLSQQIAKAGLQNLEASIAGAILGRGKNGQATNRQPWDEKIPGHGSPLGGILGGIFGGKATGLQHDGSSPSNALFVQLVGVGGQLAAAGGGFGGIGISIPGIGGGKAVNYEDLPMLKAPTLELPGIPGRGLGGTITSLFSRAGSLFGGLFKNGGFLSSLMKGFSFGGFFAEGGSVFPGSSYVVGERGPEMFTPRSAGTITPNHALGGTHIYYSIDARGTDPVQMEQRFRSALGAVHNMAVVNAQRVNIETQKRTPQPIR